MLGSATQRTKNGRHPAGLVPLEARPDFRAWAGKHAALMERQAALEIELLERRREYVRSGDRSTDAAAAAVAHLIDTGELTLPGNETLRQQIGDLTRHGEVLRRALGQTSAHLTAAREQHRHETLTALKPELIERRRQVLRAAIVLCQALESEGQVWPSSAGPPPWHAVPAYGCSFSLHGPAGVWPATGYELPPVERWARAAADAGILTSADIKEMFA